MFADCSDNPVVAQRLLSRTFFVWPEEEPWIKVPVASWFAPLLVIAFLRALNELCRRHLRRNYVRAIENMTGRVKGRIRIGEQVRQNLARTRLDCTVCEYGRLDDDCLENRILRAALEVSAVFLARHGAYPLVHGWIAACRVSLARVSITPIQHFQFQGVRQTGSFRHYRQPIRFAWAVLRHLGISPERLSEQGEYLYVPPFALCTYELFERYAEVTLRKQYGEDVWAGYNANNLGDGRYRVRPDFLVVSEREIIDCKYKNLKAQLDDNERADAYQIVSYSRHDGVLEKLFRSQERDRPSRLVLLYPKVTEDKQLWGKFGPEDCDDSFEIPLIRRRLYCPRVSKPPCLAA